MRIYTASIADREQRFAANIISVTKEMIALGEVLPRRGKPLKLGTPIHALLIHLDGAQTLFELHDQGNTREWADVERIEVTETSLRVAFKQGCGPFSGRVSLAPEIEVFDRDDHESEQLRSVRIEMKPTPTQLARLKELLRSAFGEPRTKTIGKPHRAKRVSTKRRPTKPRIAKRRTRATKRQP
jgi:hypothetical protein